MDARDIERYFALVGEELGAMGIEEPVQLLLVGGGYMLTQIRNRTATGDIDAVWVHPEVYADSEMYRLFRAAVRFVATDEDLEPSWLNTDVGDFMRAAGPLPKMTLWRRFGMVHVYLPPKDFILAHKLVASRRKDRDDISSLCVQLRVTTRKQAQRIVDTYISRDIQENHHVAEKLERLFG